MKKWYEKLAEGETVYLSCPSEDVVALLSPDDDYITVKWESGHANAIRYDTNLATEIRVHGTEITEEQFKAYGS